MKLCKSGITRILVIFISFVMAKKLHTDMLCFLDNLCLGDFLGPVFRIVQKNVQNLGPLFCLHNDAKFLSCFCGDFLGPKTFGLQRNCIFCVTNYETINAAANDTEKRGDFFGPVRLEHKVAQVMVRILCSHFFAQIK